MNIIKTSMFNYKVLKQAGFDVELVKENDAMKHEELLKEIEEQINKNRTRMYYGNICRNDLMENQDLLGRIKTVLRTADKEYERGADDAWELAKTVDLTPDEGGYTSNDIEAIFDRSWYEDVLKDYTDTQALAKLKEYEAKKKEEEEAAKLKPGDVVQYELCRNIEKAIFLFEDDDNCWVIKKLGGCPQQLSKSLFTLSKTYKHVDLEGLFEEMQEG